MVFKFWGDNVDKKKSVKDVRSDHYGSLLHMYSILAGCSRVDASELSHTGCVAQLSQLPADTFLPTSEDFAAAQSIIVSRIITHYIDGLSVLSKSVPQHIQHKYSA